MEISNEKREFEEGCLSLPNQFAKVERPENIRVQFQDQTGNYIKMSLYGLEAVCLQHEIDHLDGKLFVEHISKLKRNRIFNKLQKYKKQIANK